MSVGLQVELTGWNELAEVLISIIPELQDAVKQAVQTVGERTLQDIRNFTPVRTGYLLSSESMEELGTWTFKIYARAPYAAYVEYGTRRMAGRFYMHRGLELHMFSLDSEISSAVQAVLGSL